jgi:hypothetical protein
MPRTALTVQDLGLNGQLNATMTAVDAANGMSFLNDGQTVLAVKNADASSKTVTVRSVADEWGRTGDVACIVSAGGVGILGPFTPAIFNQGDGTCNVDFSAATSTTIAASKFKKV